MILEELCSTELMSIKGLEQKLRKAHADVVNSMAWLRSNKLVELRLTNPSQQNKSSRKGRHEKYYKITQLGAEYLILAQMDPKVFWKYLVGYCYNNDGEIDYRSVIYLFESFLARTTEYSFKCYYALLGIFNSACEEWIKDIVLTKKELTLDQKILEVLAFRPGISLVDLIQVTGASQGEVTPVIARYSSIPHKPLLIARGTTDGMSSDNFKVINRREWKAQLHKVIQISQNSEKMPSYELTLFGVVLILFLIYSYDNRKVQKLFHSNLLPSEYCDRLANNYVEKLPLIFGKWNKLKEIYGLNAFFNFDVVIDSIFRVKVVSMPAFKNLYSSVEGILEDCLMALQNVQNRGLEELFNFITQVSSITDGTAVTREEAFQKVNLVYEFLVKTTILSDPEAFTPETFLEELRKRNHVYKEESRDRLSGMYAVEWLEKSFSNEITWMFFLNLCVHHYSKVINSQPDRLSFSTKEWKHFDSGFILAREQLRTIMNNDEEIKILISNIMNDLLMHKTKSLKNVRTLRLELN